MGDAAKLIDWNGMDVGEFAALPPGRYRVELVDACAVCAGGDELVSPETEARIVAGRADVAAGRTVPWSEVDAGLGRIVAAHARR
jgi:hypothetical protein